MDKEQPQLDSMDIFSPEGTRVKFTGSGGYPDDQKIAAQHLKLDQVYTIERTEVGNWHTDVYLREVKNVAFNSVMFVVAK